MSCAVATPRSRPRARSLRSVLATVAAATIGLVILGASCAGEQPIDRLTIVNETPYDVEVQVTDAEKESWLTLGRAEHESSTVNDLVTDMGPTWVFRFHYGGRTVGEVTIDREELARARWRLEVPSAVAERMRELGFEPPRDE